MYIDRESIYSTSSAKNKINASGTFVLWLLSSFTVVIIAWKWVALVGRKITFSQSIWPAGDQRSHCVWLLKALKTRSLEKIFGPRATAVILKILHPFRYPGLKVISFEYQQLSAMFTCRDGKDGDMQLIPLEVNSLYLNLIVTVCGKQEEHI